MCLCLIILFRTATILFVYHNIAFCLVMSYYNITMLYFVCYNAVLCLVMLFCDVIWLFSVLYFCFMFSNVVI